MFYTESPNVLPRIIRMTRCFFVSLMLLHALLSLRPVKALQVIGGHVTVIIGGTATLPCELIDTTEPLSQISWQRKTKRKPVTDNFFTITPNGANFVNGLNVVNEDKNRFKFIGNFSGLNGSLQISDVTLLDEGVYSCIFTLFPSGNHKTEIPLNVAVPPVTSVKDNHPLLSNEDVPLATCTAAGSRPAAEVMWDTGTLAEKVKAITNSTQHDNGTTTTVSLLFGIPTKDINQQLVKCVVNGSALSKAETLNFTLQVYFSPMVVNISERSKGLFECLTESNPKAEFTWSRSGQSLPQSARAEGETLRLLSITSELNGLYQCKASNPFGSIHGQLYVHVTSGSCTACWVLFSLLLVVVLIAIGFAAWWYKFKKPQSPEEGTGEAEVMDTST